MIVNIIRNNNSPVFTSVGSYDITISEQQPVLEEILTVSATDIDEGRNGEVHYSMVNAGDAQSLFGINSVTGQIFVRISLLETTEDIYTVSTHTLQPYRT